MAEASSGDGAAANGGRTTASAQRLQKNQELHEVKELEKLFAQLEQFGLSIDDYFLTQEESVSGEKLATQYALVSDDKTHDVAGVAQILPADSTTSASRASRSSASKAWAR